MSIASGLIALFIFSFADKIIYLLYSPVYIASIRVLQLYSFVLFFLAIGIMNLSLFQSINKIYLSVIGILVYLFIIFIGDIMFIPAFKIIGAVVSTLLGHLIVTMGIFMILIKNGIKINKNIYVLFLGMMLSVFVGLLTKLYVSIPFFIFFIYFEGLINKEEVIKAKYIFSNIIK